MDKTTALDAVFTTWVARQDLAEQEFQAVKRARRAGASWTEIGENLGVSRQSAHERFSALVD